MGNNCCSCSSFQNKNMAKVVDCEGHMTLVAVPISVAELMIQHPGFAVSPADDIRRTHRLLSMKIHETLAPGKLYLLVPMEKLDSRVSDVQIAAINSLSKTARNKKTDNDWDCLKSLLGNCSRSRPKAWSPALEPIVEE